MSTCANKRPTENPLDISVRLVCKDVRKGWRTNEWMRFDRQSPQKWYSQVFSDHTITVWSNRRFWVWNPLSIFVLIFDESLTFLRYSSTTWRMDQVRILRALKRAEFGLIFVCFIELREAQYLPHRRHGCVCRKMSLIILQDFVFETYFALRPSHQYWVKYPVVALVYLSYEFHQISISLTQYVARGRQPPLSRCGRHIQVKAKDEKDVVGSTNFKSNPSLPWIVFSHKISIPLHILL